MHTQLTFAYFGTNQDVRYILGWRNGGAFGEKQINIGCGFQLHAMHQARSLAAYAAAIAIREVLICSVHAVIYQEKAWNENKIEERCIQSPAVDVSTKELGGRYDQFRT